MYEYSDEFKVSFQSLLQNGYVLLEFYAPWCGTCRSVSRMLGVVDKKNLFPIVKIDGDRYRSMMDLYTVEGVPMLLLLHDSKVCLTKGGSTNFLEFMSWLRQCKDFKELS